MGITICSTKSDKSFDLSYNGYDDVKDNIALVIDKEFGKLLHTWKEYSHIKHVMELHEQVNMKDPEGPGSDKDVSYHIAHQFGYVPDPEDLEKDYQKEVIEIINKKELDKKYGPVLEYILDGNYDGSLPYEVCQAIYDVIKDVDMDTMAPRYGRFNNPNWYREFKEFLLECYNTKSKMIWG